MFDSIIFDLDGTLWDTTHIGAKVWSDAALKRGIKANISADQLKSLYGLPTEMIAKKLFPLIAEETAFEIMRESNKQQCLYLEKDGGILFPGVKETLKELKKKFPIFIVSNCQEGYIQSFIKSNKLEAYFDDFEYPGRTGLSKADNIRLIIERNHLKNPIYVGDTSADSLACQQAGIPFIFAKYGFGNTQSYEYAIDSLTDLVDLLLGKTI